jgi:hypothetical protein
VAIRAPGRLAGRSVPAGGSLAGALLVLAVTLRRYGGSEPTDTALATGLR